MPRPVAVHQGVVLAGQLAVDGAAAEVIAVVPPVVQADRAVDLEQGGGLVLGHLAGQHGLILAGGVGGHGDGHAGLLGVVGGQLLPLGVLLGLEVHVVDGAGGLRRVAAGGVLGLVAGGIASVGGIVAGGVVAAAGHQSKGHGQGQQQS